MASSFGRIIFQYWKQRFLDKELKRSSYDPAPEIGVVVTDDPAKEEQHHARVFGISEADHSRSKGPGENSSKYA